MADTDVGINLQSEQSDDGSGGVIFTASRCNQFNNAVVVIDAAIAATTDTHLFQWLVAVCNFSYIKLGTHVTRNT